MTNMICGALYIEKINANFHFQPRSIEESYLEIGYKTVGEALKDYEHHYKEELPSIKNPTCCLYSCICANN